MPEAQLPPARLRDGGARSSSVIVTARTGRVDAAESRTSMTDKCGAGDLAGGSPPGRRRHTARLQRPPARRGGIRWSSSTIVTVDCAVPIVAFSAAESVTVKLFADSIRSSPKIGMEIAFTVSPGANVNTLFIV